MSWKLKNSKVLDDLYLSQLEKYNPELIYKADDIIDGLRKLNKEYPNKNIMIMHSNNSNKGFICFKGENCDKLKNKFDMIIDNYRMNYDNINKTLSEYKI